MTFYKLNTNTPENVYASFNLPYPDLKSVTFKTGSTGATGSTVGFDFTTSIAQPVITLPSFRGLTGATANSAVYDPNDNWAQIAPVYKDVNSNTFSQLFFDKDLSNGSYLSLKIQYNFHNPAENFEINKHYSTIIPSFVYY